MCSDEGRRLEVTAEDRIPYIRDDALHRLGVLQSPSAVASENTRVNTYNNASQMSEQHSAVFVVSAVDLGEVRLEVRDDGDGHGDQPFDEVDRAPVGDPLGGNLHQSASEY